MDNIWIIAQTDNQTESPGITSEPVEQENNTESGTKVPSDPNAAGESPKRPPSAFGPHQWIFLGLMFVVMYFILFRGPKKKQQQHKQMVQTLEKNDRVRTIGGIIGTVVDVKGDEITLKIDESNNTKIKVVTSAIGKNLSKEKA